MAGKAQGRQSRMPALMAAGVAAALAATGLGLWATDSGPFRDTYCWGAWQQDSGPEFLGEGALARSGAERRATESAPPSADEPHGTCTVEVASTDVRATFHRKLVLEYGAVPAGARERQAWIARYLHGSASPLPDELPGFAAGDRAVLVLPSSCDVEGRPAAVTIRTERDRGGGFDIGPRIEVAGMLLAAARTAAREAGCAPAAPAAMSSPMVKVAGKDELAGTPLCRIPGLVFEFGKTASYEEQVGVVGDRLQTCSVWSVRGQVQDEPAAQFVMAGEPRIAALFEGLPEGVDRGLVRTVCDGRRTVFYGRVEPGLQGRGRPGDRQVFENFVASVSKRIGCGAGGGA
ncbi:hypothetical protein ATE80_09380 [Streptomyces kanasensis]|uniref:Uncharacterized protein n=2 Tax=Streptomyces TaxID=1883 RepID=A0A117IWP3_9ACTN|nr:hypothetical protein ATE80_09380 [Streptomyces kanasensis]